MHAGSGPSAGRAVTARRPRGSFPCREYRSATPGLPRTEASEAALVTEGVRDDIATLLPRLRRVARAHCGTGENGDEFVQSACIRALARAEQLMPDTRLDG